MKTIKTFIICILMVFCGFHIEAQWLTNTVPSPDVVRLQNIGNNVAIGSTESNGAQLYVVRSTANSDLVKFNSFGSLGAGWDVLELRTGPNSSSDSRFLECVRGSDSKFRVRSDGDIDTDGSLNLRNGAGAASGVALRVSGQEALFYNSNLMSWGFGSPHNQFQSSISIGSAQKNSGDMLTVHDGNISINDDRDILFRDAADNLRYSLISTAQAIELDCDIGDYSVGLDCSGTGSVYFNTQNGNEKMRITDIGRVGIGTGSPLSDLHIRDAGEVAGIIVERSDQNNYVNLLSGTTGNSFYFAREKRFSIVPSSSITSTTPVINHSMFMYGNQWPTAAQRGNVGIGTDAPTEKLHVSGNIRVSGTVITSDRRLKSDIGAFKYGLDEVKKLNPVHFTYNGRGATTAGSKHVGLIAQELQDVAPELVEEFTHVLYEYDEEGTQTEVGTETYLQIRDTEVKYMLMNSIKEIAETNDELVAKNEELERKNAEMEARNNEMEARLTKLEAAILGSSENEKIDREINVAVDGKGKVAELAQNQPNPFHDKTMIRYFLPEDASGAEMKIFSADGKLIKSIIIEEVGAGQINLETNNLPAGNYMYQLATDRGVIGGKTMVLIK